MAKTITKTDNIKYSFTKGLSKTLINLVLIAGPIALQALPQDWMNLTFGGALYMLLNWAKVNYQK